MKLSDEQYEYIKGEVVALFERYDVRCIPISGFELAYRMEITLIPYSSLTGPKRAAAMRLSKDGFYIEDMRGSDIIYYNDEMLYERTNMTILHEIGHCVLDHNGNSKEEETEASFFAKYAAAPPPLVHRVEPRSPEDIAATFNISSEAAINALDYYRKWLTFGGESYKEYEIRLLHLFNTAHSNRRGGDTYVCN